MFFRDFASKFSGNGKLRSGTRIGLDYSHLEQRQLLAVTVAYNPVNSMLILTGDNANDEVYIDDDVTPGMITIDVVGDQVHSYDQSLIEYIDYEGGGGDDILINDTAISMTAYGFSGNDYIIGGSGADFIHGGPGNDELYGGEGADDVNGHEGDDLIFGGNGADNLQGGFGNDEIYGEGGDDTIGGDWDDDLIYCGDGDDFVTGYTGADEIYGGNGLDRLYGQHGVDLIYGDAGNDRIRGGPSVDTMYGGDGHDYLGGDQESDFHYGEAGNDRLVGFDGDDLLVGGAGNDNLQGQNGNDQMFGDDGNDILRGHGGDDVAYGGAGDDYARLDSGMDTFYGGDDDDRVFGGIGDDTLEGGLGDDELRGEDGNDRLRGDDGNDWLLGGNDHDSLFGGINEVDTLQGDAGEDRFLVNASDSVLDQSTTDDARLVFVDETSSWNNAEIVNLDYGFDWLQSTSAGIRLLQDSVDSGDLTFYKYADLNGSAGINYLSYSYWDEHTPDGIVRHYDFDREIHILDWDETSQFQNEQFQEVLIHEVAHNWDSELELSQVATDLTSHITDFQAISGWTDVDPQSASYTQSTDGQWWYLNDSSFFESYGQTNPYEDFGTTFEFYFSNDTTSDPELLARLNVLDAMFAAL